MIISIRPDSSNHYLRLKICLGINAYAEAKGVKPLTPTKELHTRIKLMERLRLRSTMTPTGILFSATGELSPEETMATLRSRAADTARLFVNEQGHVANDNQIYLLDPIVLGKQVGWINFQNIFVEYGPTFTVEVELP